MKNAPNSKTNLDRAILRFAGDVARSNDLRSLMANSIVAQMIGDGVGKCAFEQAGARPDRPSAHNGQCQD